MSSKGLERREAGLLKGSRDCLPARQELQGDEGWEVGSLDGNPEAIEFAFGPLTPRIDGISGNVDRFNKGSLINWPKKLLEPSLILRVKNGS